jgi:hypothetical protein
MMSDDTAKDEQKTERFNMFMSPSEMKAIEEWGWHNKIRSKSEAVRRLCQIGLLVGNEIHQLTDTTLELSSAMHRLDRDTFEVWAQILSPVWKGETLNRKGVAELLRSLVEQVAEVDGGVDDVSSILVGLVQGVNGLARAGSVSEGKNVADKAIKETNENLAEMRLLRAKSEETRKALGDIDFSDSWKIGDLK